MGLLKDKNKVLDLGKKIVAEIEQDGGIDTLSRWLIHYVAEKTADIEVMTGSEKENAERECCELILKIWDRRWSLPNNKSFLSDFEPLLETLHSLNPSKQRPFLSFPQIVYEDDEADSLIRSTNQTPKEQLEAQEGEYFNLALKIDRLARFLIVDLLKKGVANISLSTENAEIVKTSIESIDYPEAEIITITTNYDKYLESQNEEKDPRRDYADQLKEKISQVTDLISSAEMLRDQYHKELKTTSKL